jgi:hypothetical protein
MKAKAITPIHLSAVQPQQARRLNRQQATLQIAPQHQLDREFFRYPRKRDHRD